MQLPARDNKDLIDTGRKSSVMKETDGSVTPLKSVRFDPNIQLHGADGEDNFLDG